MQKTRRRVRILLITLVGLCIAVFVLLSLREQSDRIYTVTEIHTTLINQPASVLHRALLVRGKVRGVDASAAAQVLVLQDATTHTFPPLMLYPGQADQWWRSLRDVPVLGSLVPGSQHLKQEVITTYRVKLRANETGSCTLDPFLCYSALVLDAAESDWRGV